MGLGETYSFLPRSRFLFFQQKHLQRLRGTGGWLTRTMLEIAGTLRRGHWSLAGKQLVAKVPLLLGPPVERIE